MIRNLAWSATAAAALALPGVAWGADCANITASPAIPTIPQWNPLDGQPQEATFTVKMRREQGGARSARLIFLDANSSASPTRIGATVGPRYEILNRGSQPISFPQGTQVGSVNVPSTQFNNDGEATLDLKVRILGNSSASEDFEGGHTFSETLRYSVQCFKQNGGALAADQAVLSNLQLSLTIPKLVSINTAGPARINFQDFTVAAQHALISVRSTSMLHVSATTANGGKLVMGRSGEENTIIPYRMSFGAEGETLAALPLGSVITATRAGVGGSDYMLRLALVGGVPSGKLAGTYSDTITLTIAPDG
jgi:hypothetical protein